MNKKETKMVYPVCGAQFELPEHEHFVAGMAVGKDSGLGTISPALASEKPTPKPYPTESNPCKPVQSAKERIDALAAAGVDVSGMMALSGAMGGEYIGRISNGKMEIVPDDDPMFDVLKQTIDVRGLRRRWIMAQTFRDLEPSKSWYDHRTLTYSDHINHIGYEYSIKMLLEELRVQFIICKHNDIQCYNQRNRWWNKHITLAVAKNDLAIIERKVNSLSVKHCKGIPYKRIPGFGDVFVSDIDAKLYSPMRLAIRKLVMANTPMKVYGAFVEYYQTRLKMASYNEEPAKEWKDAYKGSGAYFTMQNLINFHQAVLTDDYGVKLDKFKSLELLELKAELYKDGEGWRLLGMLKKCLTDNGIDISAKRKEWAEAKRNKRK